MSDAAGPFRRIALGASVAASLLLAGLCIAGAFLGADRARAFFNSAPMLALWSLLAALLIATLVNDILRLRHPALLAMHAAPLLILFGGFLNSERGHAFAARWWGIQRMPGGFLVLREHRPADMVEDARGRKIGDLPFQLALVRFEVERYGPGGPVRCYRSVVVANDWKSTSIEAAIEVNRPLHYGGYHFYQYSFEPSTPPVSILKVVSDLGMPFVYFGFVLLAGGTAVWCWAAGGSRNTLAPPPDSTLAPGEGSR